MRYVVVTQSQFHLDEATEAFLLSGLDGLERECESVRSCRVHLQGSDRSKPFCVTLLVSTGEHHIHVRACEPTNNALTARDAIHNALGEAASELQKLRLSRNCATCSDQSMSAATISMRAPTIEGRPRDKRPATQLIGCTNRIS